MSDIKELTSLTFQGEVLDSEVPVLVDFWAPWCGPCRMVKPSLQELAGLYRGRAKVVKVNADRTPDLMERYSVRGLPTVMLFSGGHAQHTVLGVRSRQEYQDLLDQALEEMAQKPGPFPTTAAAGASGSSR